MDSDTLKPVFLASRSDAEFPAQIHDDRGITDCSMGLRNEVVDDSSVISTSSTPQQPIRSTFSNIDCHEQGNHFCDPPDTDFAKGFMHLSCLGQRDQVGKASSSFY